MSNHHYSVAECSDAESTFHTINVEISETEKKTLERVHKNGLYDIENELNSRSVIELIIAQIIENTSPKGHVESTTLSS